MDIIFIHPDRKLTGMYLQKFRQLNVDSAHDGLNGLRKINLYMPAMVVSDIDLPLLSGLSLLKAVRSHRNLHSIPFLFLSRQPFAEESMRLGANDWIDLGSCTQEQVLCRIRGHFQVNRELSRVFKSHV